MPSLKSILGLLALGSVMVDNPIPERLIKKVACVVMMIVFSCILVGALLLAAIIYGYQALVDHGYSNMEAGLYIVGGLAALAAISVGMSVGSFRTLLVEFKTGLKKNVPLTTHLTTEATNIAEAFLNGLLNRGTKNARTD